MKKRGTIGLKETFRFTGFILIAIGAIVAGVFKLIAWGTILIGIGTAIAGVSELI